MRYYLEMYESLTQWENCEKHELRKMVAADDGGYFLTIFTHRKEVLFDEPVSLGYTSLEL